MISTPDQQAVDAAITSRRSIRAYLPQPVAREDVAQILRVAARAPSGTNTQPWKVYVLDGERKQQLSSAILAIHTDPEQAKLHTENMRTTRANGCHLSSNAGARSAGTCMHYWG